MFIVIENYVCYAFDVIINEEVKIGLDKDVFLKLNYLVKQAYETRKIIRYIIER